MNHRLFSLFLPALFLACLIFSGCETMDKMTASVTSVAAGTGLISQDHAQSITRTTTAVSKTMEDITPSQEYYIGRTVAATILNKYKAFDKEKATDYLNLLGQSIALASDRPETYGGYHFLILDSDEINALAAPGGLIFITRGMLRCCKNEDAVAAVLAHEVGHVQLKHGLQAIEKGRLNSALAIVGTEAVKNLAGQEIAELTKAFEGAINDITTTMLNNGYARKQEFQADAAAVKILKTIGYDPHALITMLTEMDQRLQPGGLDFAKTHPKPQDRIKELNNIIGEGQGSSSNSARDKRFKAVLGSI